MAANVRDRVNDLIGYIKQGKIIEAMTEFYHEDGAMQENRHEPTRGLKNLIANEQKFIDNLAEFHGFEATSVGVQGGEDGTGTALMESWLEYTDKSGKRVRLEQVSVQRWENGKIRHERFYYDSAS
ncbi:MAG: polyketide cyclase [Phycisphaerae bacterium]|nr:polyketide cyclase [Phycisphaerae bacterium]